MIAELVRIDDDPNGEFLNAYRMGEIFATVGLIQTPQGYTSEWWVSRIGADYAQAACHLSLPVFGMTAERANRRVAMIATDVLALVDLASGGQSAVHGSEPYKLASVRIHLRQFAEQVDSEDVVKQAAMLYEFLSSFRVSSPAQILADVLNVDNIRTMQDRLDRARDRGLLDRPGKGKHWS
jgi:hypothetical protein